MIDNDKIWKSNDEQKEKKWHFLPLKQTMQLLIGSSNKK
jgi:hypothetical protein